MTCNDTRIPKLLHCGAHKPNAQAFCVCFISSISHLLDIQYPFH